MRIIINVSAAWTNIKQLFIAVWSEKLKSGGSSEAALEFCACKNETKQLLIFLSSIWPVGDSRLTRWREVWEETDLQVFPSQWILQTTAQEKAPSSF